MAKRYCNLMGMMGRGEEHGASAIDNAMPAGAKHNIDAHTTYAKNGVVSEQNLGKALLEEANPSKTVQDAGLFQKYLGFDPRHFINMVQDPASVLGEDLMGPILTKARELQGVDNLSKSQYLDEMSPLVDELEAKINDGAIPANKKAFSERIIAAYRDGGAFFKKGSNNPILKLTQNAVVNLVTNNPVFALYNVFEITPKAVAYGMQNAGVGEAFPAFIRAIKKFGENAKGGFWKRIPELESLGIYDSVPTGGFAKKLFDKTGVSSVLDITENPLRAISYYMGEEIQPGSGFKALENIAFVYRPGNEPLIYHSAESAQAVALMRFAIKSQQMYFGMVKNMFTGDPETRKRNAMALVSFHLLTAAQTGVASTIPEPIWRALPEDIQEKLKGMPNMAKLAGLDLAEGTRPGFGISLNLGGAMASSAIKGFEKFPEAVKILAEEGDIIKAAAEGGKGLFTAAQMARIPGINATTKRLYNSIVEAAIDNEYALQDVPQAAVSDFLIKSKIISKGE